jgi:predicted lipoprotein
MINELKQDASIKEGLKSFSKELNIIESTVNEEIIKQKEAEELEAQKKAEAQADLSRIWEYSQKLNNIEKNLAELEYLYDGPTSVMMP